MDVEGGQPSAPSGRCHPSAGGIPDRIVMEKTSVVGAEPQGTVRVFAQAADDIVFIRAHQVGQGTEQETPCIRRGVIHAAIIGSNPQAAFAVAHHGVNEFVGKGGPVLAVVPVECPLSGQEIHLQKAVVGSHEEAPGSVVREGVDVVESGLGRRGEPDGPGAGVHPVKTQVPGSQPQIAVPVLIYRAHPRGRASFKGKTRRDERACRGIIYEQSDFVGRVCYPDPSVCGDQDVLQHMPV